MSSIGQDPTDATSTHAPSPTPTTDFPASQPHGSKTLVLASIALAILPVAWALVVLFIKIQECRVRRHRGSTSRPSSPSGETGTQPRKLNAAAAGHPSPRLKEVHVTEPKPAYTGDGAGGFGDRRGMDPAEWGRRGATIVRMRSGEYLCVAVKSLERQESQDTLVERPASPGPKCEDVDLGPQSHTKPHHLI